MNWQKFANFAGLHLNLGPCLAWHIGPPSLRAGGTHPDFTFREWVEQQLEYLAVRPYKSLDQMARDTDVNYVTTTYTVWFHIGGDGQPFSRLRMTTSGDGEVFTVEETINRLVEWHSRYWAQQADRPLILDAVVCHKKAKRSDKEYYHESVGIFLVPAKPCRDE
jgi:hypothetical protein